MAKKAYIGVDGVARKIKKGYIGVDGVARRIKKAYIGIGGVARPCWSSGEVTYYGTITDLVSPRRLLTAASNIDGGYYYIALFAGGIGIANSSTVYYKTVDAYSSRGLTRTTGEMSNGRYAASAAVVGTKMHAIIAGGCDQTSYCNTVDAFSSNLTRSNPEGLSLARRYLAATSVGNYALFAGGYAESNAYTKNAVDAYYGKSLTHIIPTTLSEQRSNLAATSVGNYALFGGGFYLSYSKTVDAYNSSLTRSTPTPFTYGRQDLMAASVGDYALFAGGINRTLDPENLSTIEVYNKSLTHTVPISLSVGRYEGAATSVGDFAIFGGGYTLTNVVDAFDKSLTRFIPTGLSQARAKLAAASVGDYALFAGGTAGNTQYATVDAYTAY